MNTATENLENDHVYILRLIKVMEKMVYLKSTDIEDMETVVRVIQQYADGFHHAKEEKLLFPLLVQKGFSNEQGPVAVMLHDHIEGREFVKGMIVGIATYKLGTKEALDDVFKNMQGYAELLRTHIGKENNVLFRMADRALSEADHQELLSGFDEIETTVYSNGKIPQFITEIEELENKYLA